MAVIYVSALVIWLYIYKYEHPKEGNAKWRFSQ